MPETYGELKTLCCKLRDELAVAKAERDAAVRDLENLMQYGERFRCEFCGNDKGCDRNCAACDLVLPDELVISAYRTAINILRARNDVEKKKENEVMGLYEAIEHLDESIPRIRVDGCEECVQEHEQLKAWLVELAAFRARQEDKNELLMRDELAAAKAERDAAVADMKEYGVGYGFTCEVCAHMRGTKGNPCRYPSDVDVSAEMCEACDQCPCGHCDGVSQWSWRGMREGGTTCP